MWMSVCVCWEGMGEGAKVSEFLLLRIQIEKKKNGCVCVGGGG